MVDGKVTRVEILDRELSMILSNFTKSSAALAAALLVSTPAFAAGEEGASTGSSPVVSAAPISQLRHISVERVGAGPAVVLIPGLSMSRESWRRTATVLSRDHEVHIVQINGFGGTAAGDNISEGLLDGVVEDLGDYLDGRKMSPVALVGHSLGGTLGLMLAKVRPNLISRLLIVDTLPWVGMTLAPATATPSLIEPQAAMLRDAMRSRYEHPVTRVRHDAEMARFALQPASQKLVAEWSFDADPRVTAEAFYEDLMIDLRGDLSEMRTATMVIVPLAGSPDERTRSERLYRTAYAALPNVEMVIINNSGHFVMLDQPEVFNAALTRFLKAE